jgi:hypothetical protein
VCECVCGGAFPASTLTTRTIVHTDYFRYPYRLPRFYDGFREPQVAPGELASVLVHAEYVSMQQLDAPSRLRAISDLVDLVLARPDIVFPILRNKLMFTGEGRYVLHCITMPCFVSPL